MYVLSGPFEYNAQPTIKETTASQQLTCLTGGIPAYAFTWERDGHGLLSPSYKYSIASSGYTDNVLTITQLTSADSGVYTCTFYTYYDGFESTSITITLNVTGKLNILVILYLNQNYPFKTLHSSVSTIL